LWVSITNIVGGLAATFLWNKSTSKHKFYFYLLIVLRHRNIIIFEACVDCFMFKNKRLLGFGSL